MTIHTVVSGETVESIAAIYSIPVSRLEKDNDLAPNSVINIGQALMITFPTQTSIVKQGDTLESIAKAFNITVIELLRNNPALTVETPLTPGDELVIGYNNKEKKIYVNGFANSFINESVLKKTLPFLTYITILNYLVKPDGSLEDIQDENVIQISKAYGVAPIMFLSTFDVYGNEDIDTIHNLLVNKNMQSDLIQNTLNMLRSKGYYGIFVGFQNVLKNDLPLYSDFIKSLSDTMKQNGYIVFVALIPSTFGFTPEIAGTDPSFSAIGQAADYVVLMTYQWRSSTISEFAETGVFFLEEYIKYAAPQIPLEKAFLGLDRIAYDWAYPYSAVEASGNFISDSGAVNLANQYNSTIFLDEPTQAPYYYYTDLAGLQHFVWYKDARTGDAIINLIFQYGLKGVAIWNVMYYYSAAFIVINTQYDIVTVIKSPLNEPS
jgi:spore germination protein